MESLALDEERDRRRVALTLDCASNVVLPELADLDYVIGVALAAVRAVLASTNAHKARELERVLPDWRDRAARGRLPARDGRRRSRTTRSRRRASAGSSRRPRRGCSGRTRGSRSRRSAAAPASARPGGRPATRSGRMLAALGGRDATAVRATSARSSPSRPRAARRSCAGRSRDGSRTSPRAPAASATTRSSSPTARRETVATLGDAWKAEHSHRARAARNLLAALGSR